MYNLATKAYEGPSSQRRPTQAHEEGKRPICMFFLVMFFLKNLQLIHESIQRPTATNDAQRRPTQARSSPRKANAGPRRPTAPNDHRYVFFIMYFFLNLQLIHAGPQRRKESPRGPTAANEGPRRPTKREKGPNDARCVVWAGIGKCCLMYFYLLYTLSTKPHEGHSSQRKPTQAHKDGKRPIGLFFLILYFLKFTTYSRKPTKAHSNQRSSTQAHKDGKKAHEGPQQPTKADAGPD